MSKYSCEICNLNFTNFQDKANHIRWNHKDNTEFSKKAKKFSIIVNEKRFGKWVYEDLICSLHNCNNKISVKYREGKKKSKYFCSRSCANNRGNRDQYVKDKISRSMINAWNNGMFDHIDYTSRNKKFSSKTERLIVNHIKTKFPNDEWKSGGRLKINDNLSISRDLYSDKLKICFEYDGIWHFKDIHNQLEHKKNIDKSLELWCIENNYRLIRIDELRFESLDQIEKLIYESNESIIKIGDRY